jgi:O-antigen biosynthesis protein
MSSTIVPQYHIDSPAKWALEVTGIEIVGWLYPGEESRCVDLRARVDDRIYLGIYGLERPDTQSAFGGSLAALRTGFIQHVQVWRGARQIALDWHDGKQWREFFQAPLYTSSLPAEATKPRRLLRAALTYQTLHHLYRHFHRASWHEICRETDAVLRDVLTPTSDLVIGDHFLGHIENPGYWINVGYGKFRITGWIFGVGRAISQLSATTGVLTENRLVYPKDRPDVASHRRLLRTRGHSQRFAKSGQFENLCRNRRRHPPPRLRPPYVFRPTR